MPRLVGLHPVHCDQTLTNIPLIHVFIEDHVHFPAHKGNRGSITLHSLSITIQLLSVPASYSRGYVDVDCLFLFPTPCHIESYYGVLGEESAALQPHSLSVMASGALNTIKPLTGIL